jgi:Zn-dependent protease
MAVGRFFGVELRIHATFVFLLAFIWSVEYASNHNVNSLKPSLELVAIIFASVLLHELGHALASKGGPPAKALILLPIGGVTLTDDSRQPIEPQKDAWQRDIRIAIAGPLLNLVAAGLAWAVISMAVPGTQFLARPYVDPGALLRSVVWVNLALALINVLPAYPLDGGRVLRAIFRRNMDVVLATRRAVSIGQTIATLMMLTGMLLYMQSGDPANAWIVMIGFFLLLAAQLEERSAVFQSVLESVRLEDVMLTDFATLSPADTLEDALDKAVHSLQDDFPVIRGSDMVGVISKQKILEALRAEGNGYVQAVMNRIFEVAQKRESLASAFRKLTARNLSIIPVVEDQRLVGIVTLQNLMHSMALLAESRKLRRAEHGSS